MQVPLTNSTLNSLAGMSVTVPGEQGTQSLDAQQYAMQFYNWNKNDLSWFRNQMGLINSQYYTAPNDTLASAWFDYVRQAAERNMAGNPTTPIDLLQSDITAVNGGKGKAGKDITRVVSQAVQTSKVDAQAIFYSAAQQLLGRAPTDSEVAQFQGQLNAQEKANPIVHTYDIQYSDQGYPMMTEKATTGGVSDAAKQTLAMQQARQNPEYGAYQAATTYMNALKQAIGLGG